MKERHWTNGNHKHGAAANNNLSSVNMEDGEEVVLPKLALSGEKNRDDDTDRWFVSPRKYSLTARAADLPCVCQ